MRALRRFLSDRRGVAAVEFALVAPMMLVLYMGASQVSIGVTLNRKLQNIASTTADLVSQSKGGATTKAEIGAILKITRAMIEPYDPADVKIQILSVSIDKDGKSTVNWSATAGGATAHAKKAPYVMPSSFSLQRNRSFVIAEVGFNYKPLGGFGLKNAIPMQEESYQTPRDAPDAIACSDC